MKTTYVLAFFVLNNFIVAFCDHISKKIVRFRFNCLTFPKKISFVVLLILSRALAGSMSPCGKLLFPISRLALIFLSKSNKRGELLSSTKSS